ADIVLDELDATGKVMASFEGHFVDKSECAVIVGTWHKLDAPQSLEFYLKLSDAVGGSLEHRYAVAGAENDELVHQNVRKFWEAVKRSDKNTVASLIDYPIKVQISRTTKTLRSPDELIANYDRIFSPAYRDVIAKALPR